MYDSDMADPLAARYVSLTTFRRDGRAVSTPVWIAQTDGRYYVFSAASAGKIKRLRHDARARLAPCTARGRPLGAAREARGRIVDAPALVAGAYRALREKYGWQMSAVDWLSKLSGRYAQRAIIELELV